MDPTEAKEIELSELFKSMKVDKAEARKDLI